MDFELNRKALIETLRAFGGNTNSIVVPRAFVEFAGSLEAGMLLSQLLYWSERSAIRNRVYKTDAEWQEELSLKQYSVRKARSELEELGLIKTEVHRANGSPTVHYFINEDAIAEKWELWIRKMEIAKTQEPNCENTKSLTETTTETTTEYTHTPENSPSEEKKPQEETNSGEIVVNPADAYKVRIALAAQQGEENAKSRQKRAVSDAYESATEEERYYAAKIASVNFGQSVSLEDMARAMRGDFIYKAKQLLTSISSGAATKEQYDRAIADFLRDKPYQGRDKLPTSNMVLVDLERHIKGNGNKNRLVGMEVIV